MDTFARTFQRCLRCWFEVAPPLVVKQIKDKSDPLLTTCARLFVSLPIRIAFPRQLETAPIAEFVRSAPLTKEEIAVCIRSF